MAKKEKEVKKETEQTPEVETVSQDSSNNCKNHWKLYRQSWNK